MKSKNVLSIAVVAILIAGCEQQDYKKNVETKPVKVKTMVVTTSIANNQNSYSGTFEEMSGTSLSFPTIGTLKSINVSEGEIVRQGQLIATIDDASTKNAYDAALAAKEQALDAEKRMKQLYDKGSLAEIQWIEVQTQVRQALSTEKIAKKQLDDTKLYSPFTGFVVSKQTEVGQNVAPGMSVVKLVKIDQVKIKISVPEEEISDIQKGQTLNIVVPALGGKNFVAKVVEKGVSADPLSRSYEVKGIVDNPNHELLPGMIAFVSTEQRNGNDNNMIALPANIVQIDSDNKPFVWSVVNSKAQKNYITIGKNIGDKIEITSGISYGDKIICAGQQKVSNGMTVSDN